MKLLDGTLTQDRQPTPTPAGCIAPVFIRRLSHVYPGFTALAAFESPGWILTIGSEGLQGQTIEGEAIALLGDNSDDWALPSEGWKAMEAYSDQTGGMTMVDVVIFENGFALTLTEELAVLYPSVNCWDHHERNESLQDMSVGTLSLIEARDKLVEFWTCESCGGWTSAAFVEADDSIHGCTCEADGVVAQARANVTPEEAIDAIQTALDDLKRTL